jgi:phosphohistidine phosphatase
MTTNLRRQLSRTLVDSTQTTTSRNSEVSNRSRRADEHHKQEPDVDRSRSSIQPRQSQSRDHATELRLARLARERQSRPKKNSQTQTERVERAHATKLDMKRSHRPAPRLVLTGPTQRRRTRVTDVVSFISHALDTEWRSYLTRLEGFQQKASAKNVHDLRVSIRRLMTIIELIERFNSDNAAQRTLIMLEDQLSELGDLRDAHVEIVTIREYVKQIPELREFSDDLLDRESGYLSAAKKILSKSDIGFIQNAINRARIRLEAHRTTMDASGANKIVRDALDRSFDDVNKKLQLVTTADYSTIHSLRLAFKTFRYQLEMLQSLIPLDRKQLGTAQSLARMMGQIQNLEVLMKGLAEFKCRKESTQHALVEVWLELERRKSDTTRRFLRAIPKFGSIWKPITQEQSVTKTVQSKTLYVLRHGIAVTRGDPRYPLDSDRPLTPKGIKKMRRVAAGMRCLKVRFDVTLTSPYIRALETAFIIGRYYGQGESIQTTSALTPQVLPEEVVRVLQDRYGSCQNLLLVGHEPQLSALVSTLTSGNAGARPLLKKGGLCKLNLEKLQAGKCATLLWLLTPKQISNMA